MNSNACLKAILVSILFSLFASDLFGQSSVKELQQYMTEVRKASYRPVPKSVLSDIKNENKLVRALTVYRLDSVAKVRAKAFSVAERIGKKSRNPQVRQECVHQLIAGIRDSDSGISGSSSQALAGFGKEDFTQQGKMEIAGLINMKTAHLDRVMMLAGYLELTDQLLPLKMIADSAKTAKYKWAARIAMARLGDAVAIDYVLGKLSRATVDDNFAYDTAPDLIYTRQKEIFRFLEKIIHSDEANCESPNPDSEKRILCGYQVMEALASAIDNFPLTVDEDGDLDVEDYPAALSKVRLWLNENPGYKIKTDKF